MGKPEVASTGQAIALGIHCPADVGFGFGGTGQWADPKKFLSLCKVTESARRIDGGAPVPSLDPEQEPISAPAKEVPWAYCVSGQSMGLSRNPSNSDPSAGPLWG